LFQQSAHRLSTAEIESALVSHPSVAEAAVVGVPHDVKGQGIYCFVTLKNGVAHRETNGTAGSKEIAAALILQIRTEIGPIAAPEAIHFASGLPKTRSGKIMRRILRKIAEGDTSSLGDTSTLADESIIEELLGSLPYKNK
jgi:acetyl-CoA synthetase